VADVRYTYGRTVITLRRFRCCGLLGDTTFLHHRLVPLLNVMGRFRYYAFRGLVSPQLTRTSTTRLNNFTYATCRSIRSFFGLLHLLFALCRTTVAVCCGGRGFIPHYGPRGCTPIPRILSQLVWFPTSPPLHEQRTVTFIPTAHRPTGTASSCLDWTNS